MNNIFVGIDPGLNGGIVGIDSNENIVKKFVMPIIKSNKTEYDIKEFQEIIHDFIYIAHKNKSTCWFILEKQYVRPVSGKRACWMNGYGYGMIQTVLITSGVQTEIVNPQTWMKKLGIDSKDKKGSVKYCLRKYPNEKWTATERSKVPHDGLTDALGIAVAGKRIVGVGGNNVENIRSGYFRRLIGSD